MVQVQEVAYSQLPPLHTEIAFPLHWYAPSGLPSQPDPDEADGSPPAKSPPPQEERRNAVARQVAAIWNRRATVTSGSCARRKSIWHASAGHRRLRVSSRIGDHERASDVALALFAYRKQT